MRVAETGHLPASPARAWAALAAWEGQAAWMPDADRVTVLGGRREGVGTRVAVRTRVLGVPAFTEVLEVSRWAPGVGLEVRHDGFVRGVGRWRLRPAPGGSELLWEEDLRLPFGPLGELVMLAYRPFQRLVMRRSLRNLAAALSADG